MSHSRWLAIFGLLVACGDDGSSGSTSGVETTSDATATAASTESGTSTASSSMTTTNETTTDAESSGGSSGSSEGSGSSGSGGSSESGSSGGGLSFETDVWPLLEMVRDPPLSGEMASCNDCHATGAGGLSLPDPATAYTNLIDMPSNSVLCAGSMLVVAGDPDNSCFVVFYEERLRDMLGWVEQAETDIVRQWVQSGAAP